MPPRWAGFSDGLLENRGNSGTTSGVHFSARATISRWK